MKIDQVVERLMQNQDFSKGWTPEEKTTNEEDYKSKGAEEYTQEKISGVVEGVCNDLTNILGVLDGTYLSVLLKQRWNFGAHWADDKLAVSLINLIGLEEYTRGIRETMFSMLLSNLMAVTDKEGELKVDTTSSPGGDTHD